MGKSKTIFVQIASYRDPQLVPTVKDCLERAAHPERLTFGIAWQHGPEETLPEEWFEDERFSILDIPYEESKGACWARNRLQQLYKGERYTLQLDSHHRFIDHWDKALIGWLKQLQFYGVPKPVLTTYLPSFDPEDDPEGRVMMPWVQDFHSMSSEGVVLMVGALVKKWKRNPLPLPARFYSAHFCFTLGSFCVEVQHDPELYFNGEEISIAVRAYTHGYDLFHPHRMVAWHEYTRKNRTKHWDDNATTWVEKDLTSKSRVFRLLTTHPYSHAKEFGIYGLGNVRSVKQYEAYAGISFSRRWVDPDWGDWK